LVQAGHQLAHQRFKETMDQILFSAQSLLLAVVGVEKIN
jgi:hypothetical protein